MLDTVDNLSATIANGASVSAPVKLYEFHHLAFWMPAAWTAATLAVQLARQEAIPTLDAHWWSVADTLGEVLLPAAAGRVVILNAGFVLPTARWMRVISGSNGARVAQGAERIIQVTGRRF